MGMFDYLRCEADLPDGFRPVDGLFQTKDLACEMASHRITADGRLIVDRIVAYKDVPREERTYPDAEPGTLQSIRGIVRRIHEDAEDATFHGWLHFYGTERLGGSPPSYRFHDYRAKFTDGRLVKIELVEDS